MWLSGITGRLPRRPVMIGADVVSGLLVVVMAVPGVPLAVLIILAVSGLCTCYQLAANAAFVRATPPRPRRPVPQPGTCHRPGSASAAPEQLG
jgi:hypothetical protein